MSRSRSQVAVSMQSVSLAQLEGCVNFTMVFAVKKQVVLLLGLITHKSEIFHIYLVAELAKRSVLLSNEVSYGLRFA